MAITNLTNTKWVFNSTISLGGYYDEWTYNINFTSNNTLCTQFQKRIGGSGAILWYYANDSISIYQISNNSWSDQAYRIIEITGGTDVTNSSLIAWLEANAVQVNVTDLTGTKWVFNNTIDLIPGSYYINFVSNNNSYGYLQRGMIPDPTSVIEFLKYTGDPVYYFSSNAWTDNAYRLISITGGDDVSNPDLLVWLNDNATLVPTIDLTGWTWVGNNDLGYIQDDYFDCYFNFVSNNADFVAFLLSSGQLTYSGANPMYAYTDSSGWFYPELKTITIIGGDDVTNASLIEWLQNHGTLTVPTPTKTFDLSTLQLSAGTHVVQVKARATGYRDSNFSNSVSYQVVAPHPPQISLINNNADLQITSTNEGEEKYEICINGSSIGTFNQGYTFLHDGEIITKCLGVENYTGIITVPAEIDNMPITTLSKLAASVTLFDNCKASKIIISEGITTINSTIFTSTSETVNVVIPSTISKTSTILSSYPHDLIVGREGYIEYGWNTTIPAEGFAFTKTLTMATTFIFDIKSTITNIGNNAFKLTSIGNYAATFNMYFRQPNNVTVTFGTTIIGTGSQKSARTYNIYTDNEGVKTTFEGYAAQYTTINVYKLDGSAWE